METIVRQAKANETDKIIRILQRSGFKNPNLQQVTYVLTIPNPSGNKRWIVGVVMYSGERLCYLAVEPQHRRKGYAQLLIKRVLKDFRNVTLRVRITNFSAIRLYWKMGFKISSLFKGRSFVMRHKSYVKPVMMPNSTTKFITTKEPISLLQYILEKDTVKENGKYYKVNGVDNLEKVFEIGKEYKGKIEMKLTYPDIQNILYGIPIPRDNQLYQRNTPLFQYFQNAIRRNPAWSMPTDEKGKSWMPRFESALYNKFKLKLPNNIKSAIGQQVNELFGFEYVFEVVNKVDWRAGSFGDSHSCWFDSAQYKWMRDDLFNSGHGYAIKFYHPSKMLVSGNRKGFGRCWMFIEDNKAYIFNGRGYRIEKIAEIVSHHFGLEYLAPIRTVETRGYVETVAMMGLGLQQPPHPIRMSWIRNEPDDDYDD